MSPKSGGDGKFGLDLVWLCYAFFYFLNLSPSVIMITYELVTGDISSFCLPRNFNLSDDAMKPLSPLIASIGYMVLIRRVFLLCGCLCVITICILCFSYLLVFILSVIYFPIISFFFNLIAFSLELKFSSVQIFFSYDCKSRYRVSRRKTLLGHLSSKCTIGKDYAITGGVMSREKQIASFELKFSSVGVIYAVRGIVRYRCRQANPYLCPSIDKASFWMAGKGTGGVMSGGGCVI